MKNASPNTSVAPDPFEGCPQYVVKKGLMSSKYWYEERRTPKFIFLRGLEWSRDCINERGVMFPTDEVHKVPIPKVGMDLYKKGAGTFQLLTGENRVTIKIRSLAL